MPQLVGRKCTICRERIPSELDGAFCPQCGNPVHHECVKLATGSQVCHSCGTDMRVAASVQMQEEERRQAAIKQLPPRPRLGFVKGYRYVQAGQFFFGGLIPIALGFVLLFSPDMRADRNQLSQAEAVGGVMAMIAGVLMMGFGLWIARRT